MSILSPKRQVGRGSQLHCLLDNVSDDEQPKHACIEVRTQPTTEPSGDTENGSGGASLVDARTLTIQLSKQTKYGEQHDGRDASECRRPISIDCHIVDDDWRVRYPSSPSKKASHLRVSESRYFRRRTDHAAAAATDATTSDEATRCDVIHVQDGEYYIS